jgi:hypothetical protein
LPRRRQASANVVLSCWCHRRSLHAATTTLPPLRCAPPPFFALPPLLLMLPPPLHRCHAAANVTLALVLLSNLFRNNSTTHFDITRIYH